MKKAFGRIVASSQVPRLLSIRGPKGRGQNDSIREHITEAGFKDGDDVVIIPRKVFEDFFIAGGWDESDENFDWV